MQDLAELRDPPRFGIRLAALRLDLSGRAVDLSMLEIWVPPWRPDEIRIGLPVRLTLDSPAGSLVAELEEPVLKLRLAPLRDLEITRAHVAARRITLEGHPLLEGLELTGRHVRPGTDAPAGAGASYALRGGIAALDPAALPALVLPAELEQGPLAIRGDLQVWLNQPLSPAMQGPPQMLGLYSDGLHLSLDGLQAELAGRIGADSQGRAEGQVMVYTSDAREILGTAAELGLIPEDAVLLGMSVLRQISDTPPPATAMRMPPFRAPRGDELRLPLTFAEGRMMLGPMRIGEAPILPAPD